MGKSCTILAHVRNSKGEIVESRLFNDLLHYTSNNRELAKEYYAVGTNEEFLSQVRDSEEFQTDENGEITFKSLRSLAKIDLETDKVLQVLNQDIGQGEYPYEEALRRIQQFNENNSWSDKMLATMIPSGNGKYFVSVVPQTKTVTSVEGKEEVEGNTINEKKQLHDAVRNEELERRIKSLLRSHGVSVKFLEGDRQGGRYSTENVTAMENGLYGLIEVNENGYVTDTLAEEAGHFAIGALGDNPLVKRLENLLGDRAMQKEALGAEEYDNAALGNNPAREVAGRLVGKALQRKLDNNAPFKVLANRIANLAKRVFYNFTGNEVRWAAAKAEQIANRIAYQFVEGSNKFSVQNAIDIKETMYNCSLTVNQEVFKQTFDELGRMVRHLEAIANDQFTKNMKASLGLTAMAGTDYVGSGKSALEMDSKAEEVAANAFAFDGIVQALVQVTDYLGPDKEIDQRLNAVDLVNPSEFYDNIARNGRYLRQARVFLKSAANIIDIIEGALDENKEGGTIKIANGVSLEDIRYQDENGTWRSYNMRHALTAYRNIIAVDESRLHNLESAYFARFCEDIYGSKYVTSTTGVLWKDIWYGEKALGEHSQSIADMVEGKEVDDIDLLHRYLGSMSNNPDVIGQIADKLVKTSNKFADDQALYYRDKLMILYRRAKNLGLDTSELLEKDEKGVPTGNLITPPASPTIEGNREEDFIYNAYMEELGYAPAINHGLWEKRRDEYTKEIWEEFKKENPNYMDLSGFTRGYKWDQFKRPKMKRWNQEHSIKVNVLDPNSGEVAYVKWVPNGIYETDRWDILKRKYVGKGDDSLQKWLYDYRKIKEELDGMLPKGATLSYRLPQFKGTLGNSIRQSVALEEKGLKRFNAFRKTVGRRVFLESFAETAEDEDFGDLHTMNSVDDELLGTKLDYEEERVNRLPVFGINKLKNLQDLNSDIVGSMIMYASMATSYQCLVNVVDALEVGKQALYDRNMQGNTRYKRSKNEAYEKAFGDFWKAEDSKHEVYETGSKNMAYCRYVKFLEKQVYGITATHWGVPLFGKKWMLHKLMTNLSALGGFMFLQGNVLSGTVNTLTGFNNIFKEAISGEYFTAKDWAAAHKYYFKYFIPMWTTDIAKLRKNNKLSLFLEQMNSQGENKTKMRNWYNSRSRLNNFFRMVGYLPYSSGDHYMQAMSYLSLAHGTKLYKEDGKLATNLWNAYKKVDNKDENNKYAEGASLEFERLCPTDSHSITTEALYGKSFFLKHPTRSLVDFEDWLIWQDEHFADDVYKRNNPRRYNSYRDQFDNLSDKELMNFRSDKFRLLSNLVIKIENYQKANSPLLSINFTPEEIKYIDSKKAREGNGSEIDNILQKVRDEIYYLIWTRSDESAFMDKSREINNRLHGIYNQQDKTAWHNNWFGNAYLSMKGWILGYIEYMYSPNHYSIALGREVEGFVNTAAKIPASWLSGIFGNKYGLSFYDMAISMIAPWSKRSMKAMQEAGFTETQNYNARRMASSVFLMLALMLLKMLTAAPDKDDGEEEDQMTGLVYYFAYRTLLEQQALLYPPEVYTQGGQLLDIWPAGWSAARDLVKLGSEFGGAMFADPDDREYFYQRNDRHGRYEKYDPKYENHFIRLVPYWKSYWNIEHPYQAVQNYEFGRKLTSR